MLRTLLVAALLFATVVRGQNCFPLGTLFDPNNCTSEVYKLPDFEGLYHYCEKRDTPENICDCAAQKSTNRVVVGWWKMANDVSNAVDCKEPARYARGVRLQRHEKGTVIRCAKDLTPSPIYICVPLRPGVEDCTFLKFADKEDLSKMEDYYTLPNLAKVYGGLVADSGNSVSFDVLMAEASAIQGVVVGEVKKLNKDLEDVQKALDGISKVLSKFKQTKMLGGLFSFIGTFVSLFTVSIKEYLSEALDKVSDAWESLDFKVPCDRSFQTRGVPYPIHGVFFTDLIQYDVVDKWNGKYFTMRGISEVDMISLTCANDFDKSSGIFMLKGHEVAMPVNYTGVCYVSFKSTVTVWELYQLPPCIDRGITDEPYMCPGHTDVYTNKLWFGSDLQCITSDLQMIADRIKSLGDITIEMTRILFEMM